MKKLCAIWILLTLLSAAYGQDNSRLRQKTLQLHTDNLLIDSLSIVLGSFCAYYFDPEVNEANSDSLRQIPENLYSINYFQASFQADSLLLHQADSILIVYQLYSKNWTRPYFHKSGSFNQIDPLIPPNLYRIEPNRTAVNFNNAGLMTSGNLSRGIQIGSTQDATLNSNLNLRLSGRINREFQIEAQLSDSNIPIQPEGNTQQIQDFDRFFLRLFSAQNEIIAGDFSLQSPTGYFLQLNKNLQGLQLQSHLSLGQSQNPNFKTRATAAVVKGKYYRTTIPGIEGNQGPYRLMGKNGEQYIQIIAGSEQVWIDGKLLMRGEDEDFVINYNTAELRFTPKNLITKDKRITIAYEYTERSYARFMAESSNEWTFKSGKIYLNLYTEQDAKNQALLQDLNPDQKTLMASIGDDLNRAVSSTILETTFSNDRVLYKKTDSLVAGSTYQNILVYSIHPDSAKYQAGFSYVGEKQGNYVPVNTAANGQVYQWIAPVNGMPQGSYEPITRLVSPQGKQVYSLGGEMNLGKRTKVSAELAFSGNDLNKFSDFDANDDFGNGVNAGIQRIDPIGKDSAWSVLSSITYRRAGKFFDPVERYKSVEFERDWNLDSTAKGKSENLLQAGLTLFNQDSLNASYVFDFLDYGSAFRGNKHQSSGLLARNGLSVDWNASLLNSSDQFRTTNFNRHQLRLKKNWKKFELSLRENHEGNTWINQQNQRMREESFAFQEFELNLNNQDNGTIPWFVTLTRRNDQLPSPEGFKKDNEAWQAQAGMQFRGNKGQMTRFSGNYRSLKPSHSESSVSAPEQTLTARLEERFKLFKGGINSSTFYEIGSGLERKQEFTYLEVPTGQGYYTWTDYNDNGIQELDEFNAAVFSDQARYIRIFRPGTAYVPVYSNRFSQSLNIMPGRFVGTESPIREVMNRFNNQFALSVNRKTYRNEWLRYLNPFILNDSLQVSLQAQIRNSLSYNSSNNKLGIDYLFQQSDIQTLMSYGIDSQENSGHSLVLRLKPLDAIWIHNTTERKHRKQHSSFFTRRNYAIASWGNLLEVIAEPGDQLRVKLLWDWSNEHNTAAVETLIQNKIELGGDFQMPGKGQIHLDIQYINLKFDGNPDSPVGYVMLKGFRPGNNGMANLSIRRRINELIQVDLVYSARISENQSVIHTGNLSVRAVF